MATIVRTKSGEKIHRNSYGIGSYANCGSRAVIRLNPLTQITVGVVLCEKCFGSDPSKFVGKTVAELEA